MLIVFDNCFLLCFVDQLVRVQVEIPKRLSNDERKLIEELADLSKGKTATGRR